MENKSKRKTKTKKKIEQNTNLHLSSETMKTSNDQNDKILLQNQLNTISNNQKNIVNFLKLFISFVFK
jgi:hypothetical protein